MKNPLPALFLVPALILVACLSGCGQKGDLYLEPEQDAPVGQEAEDDDGDGDDEKD